MNCCAFTGHRELHDLDFALLDRVIKNLIKNGCKRFLCGMARGFDLAAAESVLSLKKEYPDVSLVACVPCEGQSRYFTAADRERYERIIKNCSEVVCLSDHYHHGCMHMRNRYMVDNCDVVVCYLRKNSGGTYYTVKYAEKKGIKCIQV